MASRNERARIAGGRAETPADFPDASDVRHLPIAERLAVLKRLSAKAYAVVDRSGEQQTPALPDRLVGGRR